MSEQIPPLSTVVSTIHDLLHRPGVHPRVTEFGEYRIEFTEAALVALIADQRAAAWQAALANEGPPEKKEIGADVERAIVDLLRQGPRPRGEIDQAVMHDHGCARATVSRALDSLTRSGMVEPLPARKGWRLTQDPTERTTAASAVLELLRERGPLHTTDIRQALAEQPGCGHSAVDDALKTLSTREEIAKTEESRKSPWKLT